MSLILYFAHWYLYRLAETYLLRAEARFYQGNIAGATQDVNTIRERADASQLYTDVTIGDICAERGRELYLEEWRNVELTRISHCLAMSGMPDEWGNTYNLDSWDQQSGTDESGGSYWYQRIVHYTLYNKYPEGIVIPNGTNYYTMDKRNVFWPIPNSAIAANIQGQLSQNYGYDGYDPSTKVWDSWENAVEDEGNVE
ncbi:RagB/SusD family nutrient uptake outer membrane protein [Zunongwangia endophytica]|uniref:RagB/SusD family nutrient uptake outer membrane protein n=1 Tax=Zunongwangia endophytica TaxID=1808945 RepID=A0ABV8HE26_9FLAO|nr:RagB/SusD family nutrient uptake outer membrane protein [Zunongwangia endophytica]MDN3596720.1 RagB/SusD family nutrient uptake outer membrane protein [Zunongwangia endophytica]